MNMEEIENQVYEYFLIPFLFYFGYGMIIMSVWFYEISTGTKLLWSGVWIVALAFFLTRGLNEEEDSEDREKDSEDSITFDVLE